VRRYDGGWLPFEGERAELITPVREAGSRFAAVALYLFYSAGAVRGYAFEAGMATGRPMVLHSSSELGKPLVRLCGYRPTPFSDPLHWYYGTLDLVGDEPRGFTIEIRQQKDERMPAHFRLTATMAPARRPVAGAPPLALTLHAALRVCAIADARGEQVEGLGPLTPLLAPLGRNLSWLKQPQSEGD
jgi:hypothetical protein